MSTTRLRGRGTPEKGDARWFHEDKGLNDKGYVPGAAASDSFSLPQNIASKSMCEQRWGPMKGGKFWYARAGRSESPRQCYRIERLFQITHQRPIGRYRYIGVAFARGIIAEKRGFSVDWATFAANKCARGKKEFKTYEELREHCRHTGEQFPPNGLQNLDVDDDGLRGAPDDWVLNRNPDLLDPNLLQGFDLTLALPEVPPSSVCRPLYGSDAARQVKSCGTEEDSAAIHDGNICQKMHQVGNETSPTDGGDDLSVDRARYVANRDYTTSTMKGKRKHDEDITIVEQMKDRAKVDGYDQMTSSQKLLYLCDREEELDEERRNRKAVESVQEVWLQRERAKAVQRGIEELRPIRGPTTSQGEPDRDSDYDDCFSPPRQLNRLTENNAFEDDANPEAEYITTPYSPLRFKSLPLNFPKGSTDSTKNKSMVLSDSEEYSGR